MDSPIFVEEVHDYYVLRDPETGDYLHLEFWCNGSFYPTFVESIWEASRFTASAARKRIVWGVKYAWGEFCFKPDELEAVFFPEFNRENQPFLFDVDGVLDG